MSKLAHYIQAMWYMPRLTFLSAVLLPFSWIFRWIVWLHRSKQTSAATSLPVIVVGNITVGGTGKTPLVVKLYHLLKQRGYRPAIVSKGYGRKSTGMVWVTSDAEAVLVGDEPLLMAQKTDGVVVVADKRIVAIEAIAADTDCNIVLCDDGLQDYSFVHAMEIAVIDGMRGLGNGQCLPAGPLRESKQRLAEVDLVISKGASDLASHSFQYTFEECVSLAPTREVKSLVLFKGAKVHAVAGIANPDHFFNLLTVCGIEVLPHAFSDHAVFEAGDVVFEDDLPVLMTEKDAVKCFGFNLQNAWFVPSKIEISAEFMKDFLLKLEGKCHEV